LPYTSDPAPAICSGLPTSLALIGGLVACGGPLVPRTRSSHHHCRESGCELRVQSGTRIIRFLVSFDSEVRIGRAARLGELRNRDTSDERLSWRSKNWCSRACSRPATCTSAIISAPSNGS